MRSTIWNLLLAHVIRKKLVPVDNWSKVAGYVYSFERVPCKLPIYHKSTLARRFVKVREARCVIKINIFPEEIQRMRTSL